MQPHVHYGSVFSHRPFRYYIASHFLSLVGIWMERVALGWFAWQLTGSTFWTSFITMANIAPTGLFGPFFAIFVENWDTRKVTVVLNVIMGALSVAIFFLITFDMMTIEALAVFSLALGLAFALGNPTRLVMVSIVVPREHMPSAVGYSAISYNASRVIGPAVAGISISSMGLGSTVLLNAISYLPFIAVTALIPLSSRTHSGNIPEGWYARLAGGLKAALSNRLILWCLILVTVNAFTVRSVLENLPAFVGSVFDGSLATLTALSVAVGAGAIAGAILASVTNGRTDYLKRSSLLLFPISLACTSLAGLVQHTAVTAALLFASGLATTQINIGTQTIIQLAVMDEYRARVLTWWSTMAFGAVSIGGIGMGLLGEIIPFGMSILGLSGLGLIAWFGLLAVNRRSE